MRIRYWSSDVCSSDLLSWFQDTAWRLDVAIEDVSRSYAGLTIQGPLSRELLAQMGVPGVADLKSFRLAEVELDGMNLLISRTGFTGYLGHEVALAPQHAERFWYMLWHTQTATRPVPFVCSERRPGGKKVSSTAR